MRKPIGKNSAVMAVIHHSFGQSLPMPPFTLTTYGGRQVTGTLRASDCEPTDKGTYRIIIVATETGDEVLYAGDVKTATVSGFTPQGREEYGERTPHTDDAPIVAALQRALTNKGRVRIHYRNSTYNLEGNVVEVLQSEEGGNFAVALTKLSSHPREQGFVGRYYIPDLEEVELLF